MSYVLKRVHIHNICQHEDTVMDVRVGLNALTGRNGDGKSNLLRALAYGLTGMVDGTWGSQQDLQRDGSADPGYVEINFSGGGNEFELRRFCTSSTRFQDSLRMEIDGEWAVVACRRQAVNKKMEEILGIPVNLMFQIMWGRQGELDHMLTAPAAYINSFLSSVFDTKRLESLRATLKTAVDSIATLSPDSDRLAEERRAELSRIAPPDEQQAKVDALNAELTSVEESIKELEDKLRGKPTESQFKQTQQQLQTQHGTMLKRIEELSEATRVVPEKPSYTREALEAYIKSEQEMLNKCNNSQREYASQKAELKAAKDALVREVEVTSAKHIKTIEQIKEAVKDVCELCGHKLTAAEKVAYTSKKTMLLTGYADLEQLETAHNEYESDAQYRIAEFEADIGILDLNQEKLQKDIDATTTNLQNAALLMDTIRQYEMYEPQKKELDRLQADVVIVNNQLQELQKMEYIKPEDESELLALRQRATTLRQAVQTNVVQLTEDKSRRELLEQMVAEAEKASAQYHINNSARRVLTDIRDIMSQKRAQARYLKTKIAELNGRIAFYMESSQMPFTLALNESTHIFEYTTVDGFTHPAARLSGAQRSISAVVLQMSILDVVGPRMNLFLVDEPSEALDAENKIIQAQMFSRLSTQMPDIEGTMLIVTRDEQVIDSCVQNIKVSR